MPKEHTIKFFMALGPEDMRELEKFFGSWVRRKWWYREWLRFTRGDQPLSEYRALMEAPPGADPRPVRDWGDEL